MTDFVKIVELYRHYCREMSIFSINIQLFLHFFLARKLIYSRQTFKLNKGVYNEVF